MVDHWAEWTEEKMVRYLGWMMAVHSVSSVVGVMVEQWVLPMAGSKECHWEPHSAGM